MNTASSSNGSGENSGATLKIPRRVQISEVVESRYENGERPLSWDDRVDGIDIVKTIDGEELKLLSSGGQSTPKSGWVILLNAGDSAGGYGWTLYGIPKAKQK